MAQLVMIILDDLQRLPGLLEAWETMPGEIDFDHIDRILFTSGSTIRAFVKRFGSVPTHIKAYCLGLPSLAEAKKHNINAEVLEQPGDS